MDIGLSGVTVADAREEFGELVMGRLGGATSPNFVKRLSRAIRRLHNNERWAGSLATYQFDVSTDKNIYLPYFLNSINSAVIDNDPATVQGPRYEFVHDGPGKVPVDSGIGGMIVDAGLSAISTDYPDAASTLTISAVSAGDAGQTIRIQGYDSSGNFVKDASGVPGELVTLGTSAVVTSTSFSAIKGISKPLLRSAITVTHTSTSTVLATLENWMTNPTFRCYRVLDSSAQTVIALCKRRPVPVHYDEECIFPDDLDALKLAMLALNFEDAMEPDRAQQHFRLAIQQLNESSESYKGGAQEQMSHHPWGSGMPGLTTTY